MADLIKYEDDIKTGTDKLNASIRDANKAKDDSKEALLKAVQSMDLSEQTQLELSQAILAGDSSPLGGQLSVGADSTVYPGPQERLIAEYNKTATQLAETAQDIENVGIRANHFGNLGVDDDRPILQSAIDYAYDNGISKVILPPVDYNILSEHPEKSGVGLYVPNGVSIIGLNGEQTRIFTDVDLDDLLLVENARVTLKDFRLVGSAFGSTTIRVNNGIRIENPSGYLLVDNVVVQRCTVGFFGEIWASLFNKSSFMQNEQIGIHVKDGTSVTFTSVGINDSLTGFLLDDMNYMTLISCYGERCDTAFHIIDGVSNVLTGCGSEFFNQILKVDGGINIEVGSINAGALGRYGDVETVHDYFFEFNDVQGGFFYGTNFQHRGKRGSVLFNNVHDFYFRYGRIHKDNTAISREGATLINSDVDILDRPRVSTHEATYYVDPVNGLDHSIINHNGRSPDKAFRTFRAAMEVLPKNIKHRTTIIILNDLDEDIKVDDISISNGAILTINSGDSVKKQVRNISVSNVTGDVLITNIISPNTFDIKYSNGVYLYEVESINSGGRGVNAFYSNATIANSIFNSNIGIRAERMSNVYVNNNSGNCTVAHNSISSIIYKNGSSPTGTDVKSSGGQVFSGP